MKKVIEIIEIYKHRTDKLQKKVHNLLTGWITEYFAPGRLQSLKGETNVMENIIKDLYQNYCDNKNY